MKVQATWSTNLNLDRTIDRLVNSPLARGDRTEKMLFNGWLTLPSGRRAQFQISLKGKINIYSEVDDLEEAQSILKPHTITLDGRAADWIVEKVHHISPYHVKLDSIANLTVLACEANRDKPVEEFTAIINPLGSACYYQGQVHRMNKNRGSAFLPYMGTPPTP